MIREVNNSLIYGRKYIGSGQQPRSTGGLFAFASEKAHTFNNLVARKSMLNR